MAIEIINGIKNNIWFVVYPKDLDTKDVDLAVDLYNKYNVDIKVINDNNFPDYKTIGNNKSITKTLVFTEYNSMIHNELNNKKVHYVLLKNNNDTIKEESYNFVNVHILKNNTRHLLDILLEDTNIETSTKEYRRKELLDFLSKDTK